MTAAHSLTASDNMPLCSGFGQYHTDSNDQNGPLVEITPHQVRLMVSKPAKCEKSKAQWFIPSTLKTRSKQRQIEEGRFYALWADIDALEAAHWPRLLEVVKSATARSEVFIYTSKSATADNLKSRVIVPLAEPVSGTDFQYGQRVLNDYLSAGDIEPDRATESANQICYLPNRGEEYRHHIIEGGLFNLSAWATKIDELRHLKAVAETDRKARMAEAQEKLRQRMESGQISPIAAFNAAYDVELMLETCGYRKRGNRWLSPYSESGTPGVVVEDNRWITSHQSDLDAGLKGRGDAFDLLVQYQHGGDRNAALKAVGEQFTTTDGLTLTKHNQIAYMQSKEAESEFSATLLGSDKAAKQQSLKLVDLSNLMQSRPEKPRFVIDPWLPRRHVTLFGGHGGIGKSNLALTLCAHVAAGSEFAGMKVEQGKALFVSLEDEPSIVRYRLREIIDEYDLHPFNVVDNLELLDGTEDYAALIAATSDSQNASVELTSAYQQICEHAKGATLVVIDNASDAFDANENIRRLVRQFIRALGAIARENDAALMLLAHIDKQAAKYGSSGNSYSGSTAWHNSSRSRLAYIKPHDGPAVVEHEKLNVGKKAQPLTMTTTAKGVPVPMESLGQSPIDSEAQDRRDLIACFQVAEAIGLTVYKRLEPGGYSAMSALANLEEYPERFRYTRKREVPKLLTAMLRDGVLVHEAYMKSNRQMGEKLTLAPAYRGEICSNGRGGEASSQSEGGENAA